MSEPDEVQPEETPERDGADDAIDAVGVVEPPSVEALAEAKRAIEAMVLVATDPVEEHLLAQLLELPQTVVCDLCAELATSYETESRGFQFVQVAGGWRYQTHPDVAPYIERYVLEGQAARLSGAALETLAIVAYKQPISRGQVAAIRGVNVDGVLRTLTQRGYIDEVGRDLGPGQATLFGTTQSFLEKLGLASLDDLPPLGDFVPSADVVEALEQTLRADSDEAHADKAEPVETAEPVDVDGETAVPAEVDGDIDLTDPAAVES